MNVHQLELNQILREYPVTKLLAKLTGEWPDENILTQLVLDYVDREPVPAGALRDPDAGNTVGAG